VHQPGLSRLRNQLKCFLNTEMMLMLLLKFI
jgi:hypothetical protein